MAGDQGNQASAAATEEVVDQLQASGHETPGTEDTLAQDSSNTVQNPLQTPSKPTNKERRLAKRAAKPDASPQKHKQRRELDVLNRIRWDEQYNPADIVIGYLDRHSEQGLLEIDFEAWERESTADEFIPLHRIKYFRRRDEREFLWHRNLGVDRVFGDT